MSKVESSVLSSTANQAPSLPNGKSPTYGSNSPNKNQPLPLANSPSVQTPKTFVIKKKQPTSIESTSASSTQESPTLNHTRLMSGIVQEIVRKGPSMNESPSPKRHAAEISSDKIATGAIKQLLNSNLKTIVNNQKLVNETHERESSQTKPLSIRIENSHKDEVLVEIPVTSLESDNDNDDEKITVLIPRGKSKSDLSQRESRRPPVIPPSPAKISSDKSPVLPIIQTVSLSSPLENDGKTF
jgi:hypothetical protein